MAIDTSGSVPAEFLSVALAFARQRHPRTRITLISFDTLWYEADANDGTTAAATITVHKSEGSEFLVVVKTRIPAKFRFDPMRDIRVLCPINRGSLASLLRFGSLAILLAIPSAPQSRYLLLPILSWRFLPNPAPSQTAEARHFLPYPTGWMSSPLAAMKS
jgi:hypothetical protein